MTMNIESRLHAIDQSFENKQQREVYFIYIMIFGILFAVSYLLFWDSSKMELERVKAAKVAIENKVTADKLYLKQNPPAKIKALQDEIVSINKNRLQVDKNNEYIKYKISQISELFYNEKAWGKYIDSISENAKKYKVKLSLISNKKSLGQEKFGHVLDISILASGKYARVIKFIDSMEQSDLVIDLHEMNLSATEVLVAEINSSVWGIVY